MSRKRGAHSSPTPLFFISYKVLPISLPYIHLLDYFSLHYSTLEWYNLSTQFLGKHSSILFTADGIIQYKLEAIEFQSVNQSLNIIPLFQYRFNYLANIWIAFRVSI